MTTITRRSSPQEKKALDYRYQDRPYSSEGGRARYIQFFTSCLGARPALRDTLAAAFHRILTGPHPPGAWRPGYRAAWATMEPNDWSPFDANQRYIDRLRAFFVDEPEWDRRISDWIEAPVDYVR